MVGLCISSRTRPRMAMAIQARLSLHMLSSLPAGGGVALCMVVDNGSGWEPGRCLSNRLLSAATTTQSANANGGNGGDGMRGRKLLVISPCMRARCPPALYVIPSQPHARCWRTHAIPHRLAARRPAFTSSAVQRASYLDVHLCFQTFQLAGFAGPRKLPAPRSRSG